MNREVSHRNVLRRIEDTANAIAKDYTNLHLMPRGTAAFLDQGLRGTLRFGKRRGNFLPTIAAENNAELVADISPPADTLYLSRVVSGMEVLEAIADVETGYSEDLDAEDVPITPVLLIRATVQ